jgi:hypothetical protein
MISLFLLALAIPAHAGKLADGVKGYTWGAQPEPPSLKGAACTADPEPGILWTCTTTIGATPVRVSPGYRHGHLSAMLVSAQGRTECGALMGTLVAAYGPSRPISEYLDGPMDDRAWFDGDVIGTWNYNQFTRHCDFVAVHMPSQDAIKVEDEKAAATAAGDL